MTTRFDPYHTWLGIPPVLQPADYYRLLGLQTFESDPTVIDHAADRQMAHVRGFQHGPHGQFSQQLLNEISSARWCLLDPALKAKYDAELRRLTPSSEPPVAPPQPASAPTPVLLSRRGQKAWLLQLTMIVLGGIAGLALGDFLLWQFARIDVLGRRGQRPRAAIASGQSKPTAPDHAEKSPNASPAGKIPAAMFEPQAIEANAAAPVLEKSPNSARPDPQEQKKAAENASPPSPPGPPSVISPPAVESVASEAREKERKAVAETPKQAVPSTERQASIRMQIDELFKPDEVKQGFEKLMLARELARVAVNTKSSADERFVLVRRASELAVEGGDLPLALRLVTDLNGEFEFDLLVVTQATIIRFVKTAAKEAAIEAAVAAEMELIAAAKKAGRYDLSLEAAEALYDMCQKPGGAKSRKQASEIRDEARRLQVAWTAYQNAVDKLKESPDDAEANLAAGRWLCLQQGEWHTGLAFLTKGSDESLAAAAKLDLSEAASVDEMLSRADQWYVAGMGNVSDRGFLARAALWYRRAQPQATGLAKAKADKRLAEITNIPVDPAQSPSVTTSPKLRDSTLDATKGVSKAGIGSALTGREVGRKKALLEAYGGNATTESAVIAGLEWLKKHQMRDGGWSLVGPYSDGALTENRCAATAMALLALQGYGTTNKPDSGIRPDCHDAVESGWNFLLKTQDVEGFFKHEGTVSHRAYAQAQATIAICEIYGMTKDPKFKRPAQLALDFAEKAQSPELGGWRYQPRSDSDTSVTGWYVMALQTGLMAGLKVDSSKFALVSKFLDRVQREGGSQYSYQIGEEPRLTMTAEALLCRQYLGWNQRDPRMRTGIDQLLASPIAYNKEQNVYYWYYATQACHHMDGNDWKRWNEVMREAVPAAQIKNGNEKGSWTSKGDRWGSHGGRLYTTCFSILMLETYYRHLPIFKAPPGDSTITPPTTTDAETKIE